jgi:hypothetical protein
MLLLILDSCIAHVRLIFDSQFGSWYCHCLGSITSCTSV